MTLVSVKLETLNPSNTVTSSIKAPSPLPTQTTITQSPRSQRSPNPSSQLPQQVRTTVGQPPIQSHQSPPPTTTAQRTVMTAPQPSQPQPTPPTRVVVPNPQIPKQQQPQVSQIPKPRVDPNPNHRTTPTTIPQTPTTPKLPTHLTQTQTSQTTTMTTQPPPLRSVSHQSQQRQPVQTPLSNRNTLHSIPRPVAGGSSGGTSGVPPPTPTPSNHTLLKTDPQRSPIRTNNTHRTIPTSTTTTTVAASTTTHPKSIPSYPPIPSHTNVNTIAAARAAALSTTTTSSTTQTQSTNLHRSTTHNQQPQPPSIGMNTTALNASTILKPSKKRNTKRGSATTPTVTMATTTNPTTHSGTNHNNGGNSNNGTTTSTGGENTGRWTAEEHRLFLQGLEQHGKGWKKIASLIKSRTVVQIRTHAQKYFQKLAKARQNGEEGDVSMEGRGNGPGGVNGVGGGMGMGSMGGGVGMGNGVGGGGGGAGGGGCHGGLGYPGSKRRRHTTTGTKRKAISSVVASMQREAKRLSTTTNGIEHSQPQHPRNGLVVGNTESKGLPAIAPVLAPFVFQPGGTVPPPAPSGSTDGVLDINGQVTIPSITTAHHGTISGSALEDSLFRFLTPATGTGDSTNPPNPTGQQLNNVARQAGANPITLPTTKNSNNISNTFQSQLGGDVSPTGVADIGCHPNWNWGTETPTWYSKGADVDELLNEADALDWLADSGDLNETYEPATIAPTPSFEESNIATAAPSPAFEDSNITVGCVPTPPIEDDEQQRQALAAAAAAVAGEVQGQSYEPQQLQHQESSGLSAFNLGSMSLPPSLPALNTKAILQNSELNSQFSAPDGNVSLSLVTREDSKSIEETGSMQHHSVPMAVNMPPLPSLFESGNSINVLNEMKRKDSTVSAVGNISSSSLFVSANDSADGFFGDGALETMEEEEFVTSLLD